MELYTVSERNRAFKSWIIYEATVRVTFRGKCILNDFGRGFPSEFEFFADAIVCELVTLVCFNTK